MAILFDLRAKYDRWSIPWSKGFLRRFLRSHIRYEMLIPFLVYLVINTDNQAHPCKELFSFIGRSPLASLCKR